MLSRREAQEKVVAEDPYYALEDMDVRGVPWRVYRNTPGSMREVLEATQRFGDRAFLVYEDQRWSFVDHFRIVAGLAQQWRSWGIGRGDRVAIAMRNYPEWVMSFWVTQALGAVAVPLNAWWTADELAYALADSGARMLVADAERAERVVERRTDLGRLERVIAVRARRSLPDGVLSWEQELDRLDPEAALPEVAIGIDDDATIMYTSGTTGTPKGAIATNRNHLTNLRNTELSTAVALAMVGMEMPEDPPQANMLQTFPFFHIGGLSGLYVGTAFGAKLCLMYKWDTAEAVEIIEREAVNSASMVPTLLRRLLEYASEHDLSLGTLAGMAAGGAPVPADLIRHMESHFERRVSPANGYGLTETTSAVVVNSGSEYFENPDSVGRTVPGADLRIVGPEGGDRPAGEVGELWFRGPNIVRGYWNKPVETAEAFTDGWFHTGDLGYVDDDGLVYVVDRLKDVIIRSGENVYCAEVEGVLFEHPAVADVALIGLPHESWGEEVVAVVEPRPGAQVSAADLQEHVAGRLARFKVPTQVHFISEPLPRTATGKVLKRDLRNRFAQPATSR